MKSGDGWSVEAAKWILPNRFCFYPSVCRSKTLAKSAQQICRSRRARRSEFCLSEGSTLFDLIQTGLTYSHVAVGVVVRLRAELSLVKDVPALIAGDQYNSWFTFSGYEEPLAPRSCHPIHARELSTVNAFRSMMRDDMMAGAFSHSRAVGKLRKDLPSVPLDARINLPRYTLDEASTVCHYYLRIFLKCNKSRLQQLPCQICDPIPLGEGAGAGWMKGVDSMAMPEGSTLFDLIQTGLTYSHAAVGVVVRLRAELSLVKDVPVLIAVDQYNSWFTFSGYEEPLTPHSCHPIHARELSTVNALRSMMRDDMMLGAFSHSTVVGKLRKDLPSVPLDARINLPRYTLDEASTVCHYYLRIFLNAINLACNNCLAKYVILFHWEKVLVLVG